MKNYCYLLGTVFLFLITGCANDSTDDLTEPITGPVTYQAHVKAIFNNNCISCHGGVLPQMGLSLETYAEVRAAVESGKVLARMTNVENPMPPTGLLPSTTLDVIRQWRDGGYLEE